VTLKHKIIIRDDTQRARAIEVIRATPEDHEVVIRPHKSKRTLDQNALYWKWLDIIRLHIADSTGQFYSAEDLHEFFKSRFTQARTVEVGGDVATVRRTTTKLNTAEFSAYMEAVDRYCIDRMQLYLPQPGMEDVA
jgi:hypothetical protein